MLTTKQKIITDMKVGFLNMFQIITKFLFLHSSSRSQNIFSGEIENVTNSGYN